MNTPIALTHGKSRDQNITEALESIAKQIQLRGKKSVVIKPNLVATERAEANTHPDAVRAVLEFIRQRYDGQILIAEGAALCNTMESFERFGFVELAREFNAKLVDLNASDAVKVYVYNFWRKKIELRLAKEVVESDYRISVNPPKTHNTVIVTLSIKNMVLGSLMNPTLAKNPECHSEEEDGFWKTVNHSPYKHLVRMVLPGEKRSDKLFMHQGWKTINLNIAILAPKVKPHLAVIDGFQGMEGAGPTQGKMVDWGIAVVGNDAVAVDHYTAHLMGFDPARIGYLNYCRLMGLGEGELENISIMGNIDPGEVRRNFEPSPLSNASINGMSMNQAGS